MPRRKSGFSEDPQAAYTPPLRQKVEVGEGGRLVIPAPMRESLGIKPGDKLIIQLQDNELQIYTFREAGRRAHAILREVIPEGVSLVDELIAERRKEAARERDE